VNGQRRREGPEGDRSPLFLVELRVGRGDAGDLEGMQAALRLAVSRIARSGVAIRWVGSVPQRDDARCLCLVEASELAHVALARDTAGLTATVQLTEEERS
jgi:hypothetical protein